MPTPIDLRPGQLPTILAYPGRPRTVNLTWPTSLGSRTFTGSLGADAFSVTVAGTLMSFSVSLAAGASGRRTLTITETTGGGSDPIIVADVQASDSGTTTSTVSAVVVIDSTSVDVTLIGDTGPTGATGAKGDKGDTGATGATGPALPSTINAQTGTTYTLVLGDAADLITLSNSSAITLTVPPNSSVAFPVCSQVSLAQIGAGQVTVAGDTGVTVNATPGLKLRAQYSAATLIKTGTDSWLLVGDLSS